MICCEKLTNLKFNYKFIDDDTIEIWDGEKYKQNISYNKWCKNYYIVDKWRCLREEEIYDNKQIWVTYMSKT